MQYDHAQGIQQLLQKDCRHQRPITQWIARDDKKCDLPRERKAHESVVQQGMRDRWRLPLADQIFEKVQRRDLDQPGDPRQKKYPTRKTNRPPE